MKSNRGSLLYESLFAFMLFATVVIMIVSLFTSINKGRMHIDKNYNNIIINETQLSKKEDFLEVIDMVLP